MNRRTGLLISICFLFFFFISGCEENKKKHSSEILIKKDIIKDDSIINLNDTLDVRLVLSNKSLENNGNKIDYQIFNNSIYQISIGDSYKLYYSEFGTWGKINPRRNSIWYDIETVVYPKDSALFTIYKDFFDFEFPSGKYLVVKDIYILNNKYNNEENECNRFIGQQVLKNEFVID